MKQIEEIIQTHFNTESILNTYQVRLKKSVTKTFGSRSYRMDLHKQKDKKLVETNNYWFYDDRGKPRLYKIFFYFLPFFVIYYIIRGSFTQLVDGFGISSLIIFAIFFVLGNVSNLIRYINGSNIKVFKKEYTQMEKIGDEIKMSVKLPKHSRYYFKHYLRASKLFDKMGSTVTTIKMEFNYTFETDPYSV